MSNLGMIATLVDIVSNVSTWKKAFRIARESGLRYSLLTLRC